MNNRMQRTTAPPSFDVYRSLSVSPAVAQARNSTSSPLAEQAAKTTKEASHVAQNAAGSFTVPYPPVPVASLVDNETLWLDNLDIEGTMKKLSTVCSKCELRRSPSSLELVCKSQLEDGNEQCSFIINLWAVPEGEPGAHGKYLLQVDRCSGCPYLFKNTLAKAFEAPSGSGSRTNKLFRVPKLPECFCDKGAGIKKECVENAIALATSDLYEQRIQGLAVLAELCTEKHENFAQLFREANGPLRIGKIQAEESSFIKRAVDRILTHCA